MEFLTKMIIKAVSNKEVDLHPICKSHMISTFMFGDELILFAKPNANLLLISFKHLIVSSVSLVLTCAMEKCLSGRKLRVFTVKFRGKVV